MRRRTVLAVVAVLAVPSVPGAVAASTATYTGAATCISCHAAQAQQWRGSHHDRAMEVADEAAVLGDFDDARFRGDGTEARFFRKEDKYFVHTDAAGGAARDFEVKYTFGFDPLQQYLLDTGNGRLQALSIAWDTRPATAGGQRWFHLQAGENVDHDDPLHWSGPFYNWNLRCASCHSTDLRKNFDLASRSYATAWSDIDVACEACHGPGSAHVAWARQDPATRPAGATYTVDLATQRGEIETCAPCHSRRRVIADPAVPGTPYLDAFVPDLLLDELYFADGQIDEEVYVYGSFVQSRMYAAGVRCSDCHDPHSLRLRSEGNGVCVQCHNPAGNARFPSLRTASYDDPAHHHHTVGSEAARCVSCHMPARTYMVLDDRRDHGMRLPRPDLSVAHGVPNACNGCHTEQGAEWAAAAIVDWFGPTRPPHWTGAIAAGRAGRPEAVAQLTRLAGDTTQPAIARATAVNLLERFGAAGAEAIQPRLGDGEPLVRIAAARALDAMPLAARRAALPLLTDTVRAVRVEAARPLAALPREQLGSAEQRALAAALDEYRAAQRANLDTPEAHLNLALLHATLGDAEAARRSYETAIEIGPYFIPAYVNLADLHRAAGREADAERVLRRALDVQPDSAAALHSLGLALVRQKRTGEALAALGRAAELDPGTVRYAYTWGVALHSTGKPDEALVALAAAHRRHPADADVLAALTSMHHERGDTAAALGYARQLAALMPDDPQLRALVAGLERAGGAPPRTP